MQWQGLHIFKKIFIKLLYIFGSCNQTIANANNVKLTFKIIKGGGNMSTKHKKDKKVKHEAAQAGNNYLYNNADGSNYKKVAFLKNHSDAGVLEPSLQAVMGQPQTTNQLVNKYGTYNIQPTNDSGNEFPCISQGFPRVQGAGRESHEAITHDDW